MEEEFEKLKKSYNELRGDYTKKCMELSKLKKVENKENDTPQDEVFIVPPTVLSDVGSAEKGEPLTPKNLREAGEMALKIMGSE